MVSNNRKSVGRFLSTSRILFFASLLILVFFSINLTKQIINRRDLQKDVDKLQNQIDSLQSKNQELAGLLAGKFKMRRHQKKNELVGLGGRLVILRGQSHWDAMISRLVEAF